MAQLSAADAQMQVATLAVGIVVGLVLSAAVQVRCKSCYRKAPRLSNQAAQALIALLLGQAVAWGAYLSGMLPGVSLVVPPAPNAGAGTQHRRLCLLGERNSGTNLVESLLRTHFMEYACNPQGGHSAPFSRTPLGCVPAPTGCSFARSLATPSFKSFFCSFALSLFRSFVVAFVRAMASGAMLQRALWRHAHLTFTQQPVPCALARLPSPPSGLATRYKHLFRNTTLSEADHEVASRYDWVLAVREPCSWLDGMCVLADARTRVHTCAHSTALV